MQRVYHLTRTNDFCLFAQACVAARRPMAPHVNKWSPLDGAHE